MGTILVGTIWWARQNSKTEAAADLHDFPTHCKRHALGSAVSIARACRETRHRGLQERTLSFHAASASLVTDQYLVALLPVPLSRKYPGPTLIPSMAFRAAPPFAFRCWLIRFSSANR